MDNAMDKQVQRLEAVLASMVEAHGALAELLERKHDALRRGQEQTMDELTRLEGEKLRAIAQLETERASLAGALTERVAPGAGGVLRVRELAEQIEEPMRGRLLVLAAQLRERMQAVRSRSSVTRAASESLLRHVQGVMQTVGVLATGVSTYGRSGSLSDGATAVRTLNVTG